MAAAATSADTQQPPANSKVSALIGKRKRQDEEDTENDVAHSDVSREDTIYEVLPELLEALESVYPFASTILARQIPSHSPSTKRTKRSPDSTSDAAKTSIQSQIDSKAYQTFQELVDDFDKAVDDIVRDPEASQRQNGSSSGALPTTQQARSLQAEIRTVLGPELADAQRKPLTSVSGNGDTGDKLPTVAPRGQTTLTLFGTAGQGHPGRQYFASPRNISIDTEDALIDPMITAMLPNGILATTVLPSQRMTAPSSTSARTLKDILPSPSQLPPYKPPTAPPARVTRSQLVEWYKPSAEPPKIRPGARDIYAEQPLIYGQWISYLAHADTDESSSEKRLKRDRALSGGEGPDESELEFLQQQRNSRARAKKSSLFRSAFSSFGPTRDDSNAVVPAETRGQIWWDKIGRNTYNSYCAPSHGKSDHVARDDGLQIDPALLEKESREIQEAVDAYMADDDDLEYGDKRLKDEDDMLAEITDAIEALLMYQQDRMKALPQPGRQVVPQQPSAAEQQIYETMKAQLLLIVSQLPPHAVSRLNGDKLGKLNISTAIPITLPSFTGSLEEPERPSAPAVPTGQVRPTNAIQQSSAGRMIYQQGTSTPPTRPNPQPPRSAAATTTHYGNRTQAPAQYGYQSQTVQQPQRSYQYSQQQQQTQASQAPNGYRTHTQNGYQQQYGQYASQGTGSPAARPPHANQYTNRAQQGYQPRPGTYQANAAQMTSAAAGRSASPQNASNYNTAQNRPVYGTGQGQGQQVAAQNGQYAAGYARPASGNSAAAAQSSFAVGGVKFSDEDLVAIEQRRHMQTSPPLPQTPTGVPGSANGGVPSSQTPRPTLQTPTNGA